MPLLVSRVLRLAARRIASDPRARAAAAKAAQGVADEVKQVMRDEDPARAAGRSLRRVLDRVKSR